jgi:hypothetical protein
MRFLAFFIDPVTKCPQFAEQVGRTSQMSKNKATKRLHFAEKPAGHRKHVGKSPVRKRLHVAKQLAGRHKWVPKCCDNRPNFASGKGGHDVTEHFGDGGHYVTIDKPSTLKAEWTKNTWTDRIGGRMSQ